MALSSFDRPIRAVVVGSTGGIGTAFVNALADDPAVESVLACARTPLPSPHPKVRTAQIDIRDENSIERALVTMDQIDLAIVATGRLHVPGGMQPEKSWRSLEVTNLLDAFAINAIGPALVAKHVLPRFPRKGKAVVAALSARVGSISDNHLGGWYGYRASKAALNQFIRTFSIELARQRKDAICAALHPGTVDSALSKPFQGNVAADKLFTPNVAAGHLLDVIDQLTPAHSGRLFDWAGKDIAP